VTHLAIIYDIVAYHIKMQTQKPELWLDFRPSSMQDSPGKSSADFAAPRSIAHGQSMSQNSARSDSSQGFHVL
jgi:hypothetical protein